MASTLQRTVIGIQHTCKFNSVTEVRFYKRLKTLRQSSKISRQLTNSAFCGNRCRQYIPRVNKFRENTFLYKRCYSSESLLWEEDGQTLVRSPYSDVDVPEVSFAEYIFSKLDKHKNLDHVVDHLTNRTYTGAQLKEASIKIASALVKMGYKKGDVILILATNSPEYSAVLMACTATGMVFSTANPAYTPGELARQLSHCEAKAIVTMVPFINTVNEAIRLSPDVAERVKDIITIDGEADKCRPIKSLLEDDGRSFPENVDTDPYNDVAALPYSSGTTGLPKGVMLTHRNLVANVQQIIEGPMKLRAGEDILLGLLPFFHIYGLVLMQFGALSQGTKLVTLPQFEPKSFLECVQKHKITYMHIAPPLALFLAKQPEVDNYNLTSLQTLLCGAAPLGGQISEEVEQRLGVHLLQGYGFTEVSPVTHYDKVPPRIGTIGQLVPNTLAKIVDPESKNVCRPGEEGELVMKGPQVMKGYLKNQEATDACINDGWICSGDIGRVDQGGYFTITDRLKELIKYKGYQVAPAELEALLCTHPSIQDAAVVGLKVDESVGEIPKAFVVLKQGTDAKPREIEKFVEQNVAPYKKVRGGVEVVSSIPKSPSGKILRRILRDQIN